jgi:hypothetical protein
MSFDRWAGPCGEEVLERLLQLGKFGNMERSDMQLRSRSLSIC